MNAPTNTQSPRGGVRTAAKMRTYVLTVVGRSILGHWLQVGLGARRGVTCLRNSLVLNVFRMTRDLCLEGNLLTLLWKCFTLAAGVLTPCPPRMTLRASVACFIFPCCRAFHFAMLRVNGRPAFTVASNLMLQKPPSSYHNAFSLWVLYKQSTVLLEHDYVCMRSKV